MDCKNWIQNGQIIHALSGKCLDDDQNNEDSVQVYTCNGVAWQKWNFEDRNIINSDSGLCLDIWMCADGCSDGSDVRDWECLNGPNQVWEWGEEY